MNIIIAGGSGLIGTSFTARVVQEGHKIWILSRNPGKVTPKGGVTTVHWDGKTTRGWGDLVDEADAVINLTGENLAGGLWTASRKQRFLASRVIPGKAITEAILTARRRPMVLLQSSGIGYYGNSQDRPVDESSPPGTDFMAQLCVQWEESTRAIEEVGVRRVVMRNSIVLAKESLILRMFMLPFRMFVGGPLGNGRQYVPWIHIQDQVGAMLHLMQNDNASGVFNLTAPQVWRNKEFEKTIGRALKRPYWFPVPGFALRLVIGEMSAMVLEGQFVNAEKLIQSGFVFSYPTLAGALEQILAQR